MNVEPRVFEERSDIIIRRSTFNVRSAGGGQVLARLWRVGRSSFKTTPYGINATCERLQNNLALMGLG